MLPVTPSTIFLFSSIFKRKTFKCLFRIHGEVTLKHPSLIVRIFFEHILHSLTFVFAEVDYLDAFIVINKSAGKVNTFLYLAEVGKICDIILQVIISVELSFLSLAST